MKRMECIQMKDLMNGLFMFLMAFTLTSCGDDTPASPDPTPTDEKGGSIF